MEKIAIEELSSRSSIAKLLRTMRDEATRDYYAFREIPSNGGGSTELSAEKGYGKKPRIYWAIDGERLPKACLVDFLLQGSAIAAKGGA